MSYKDKNKNLIRKITKSDLNIEYQNFSEFLDNSYPNKSNNINKTESKFTKLKFTNKLKINDLKKNQNNKKINKYILYKYKNIPGIKKLHHLSNANVDNLILDNVEFRSKTESNIYYSKNNTERKIRVSNNRFNTSSYSQTKENFNERKLYLTNAYNRKYNRSSSSITYESRKLTRNVLYSYSNDINCVFNKNYDVKSVKNLNFFSLIKNKKKNNINAKKLNLENTKNKYYLEKNKISNLINNKDNKEYSNNKFKRYFKIDYRSENKYNSFRNQIVKQKNKIYKIFVEIKLTYNKFDEKVEKNTREAKKRKYIVKTLYN